MKESTPGNKTEIFTICANIKYTKRSCNRAEGKVYYQKKDENFANSDMKLDIIVRLWHGTHVNVIVDLWNLVLWRVICT